MNKKEKQAVAYLDWRAAWRMRCCPPENHLYGKKTVELNKHLQLCPWCREELENISGKGIFSFPVNKADGKRKAIPEPGQLWSLKQSLGGWGPKGRYYSPPLVVVAERTANSVTVFQSFGDMSLAGKNDLPFQTDLTGFLQPWNRYCLRLEDLDICFGRAFYTLSEELNPPETLSEQPTETGSLLWFFRQMEVETGYYFASRAVTSLMAEHEGSVFDSPDTILTLLDEDKNNLDKRLRSLGLVLPLSPPPGSSALDLILLAQPAEAALPLAAADRKVPFEYALCFLMKNGEIISVETTDLCITNWKREGVLLHVSGNLKKPARDNSHPFFQLKTKTAQFEPIPGEYGIERDFFWALFLVGDVSIEEGECIVRIITNR